MDSAVAVAAIGVGGTVVVAAAGFGVAIWTTKKSIETAKWTTGQTIEAADRTTRQTIASDRANRIWDKRAAAYEAALAEIVNRRTSHERWMGSEAETWTEKNVEELLASRADPEWSAVQARLLAYSSPPILKALDMAWSADQAVSQAMDKVAGPIRAGKSEKDAAILSPERASLLKPVQDALDKSVTCDKELIALVQTALLEGARDHPPAPGPGEAPPG